MAIPFRAGFTVQETGSRSTKTFIMGRGAVMTPAGTLATSPDTTFAGRNPAGIQLLGADSAVQTIAIPALASGARTTLAINIAFRNLASTTPYPKPSINQDRVIAGGGGVAVRKGASLIFIVNASFTQSTANSVVGIIGQFIQPVATGPLGVAVGPNLPSGQTYAGFSAQGNVTLNAFAAYSGGTNLLVYVSGSLYLQQG